MKLFQAPHTIAAKPFPLSLLSRVCAPSTGSVVSFSFHRFANNLLKAEQLGIQFEQKWSLSRRKVNENLCKKNFLLWIHFPPFII
jgi:hypothetical protein